MEDKIEMSKLPTCFENGIRLMQEKNMTDDEILEVLDTFRKECSKRSENL